MNSILQGFQADSGLPNQNHENTKQAGDIGLSTRHKWSVHLPDGGWLQLEGTISPTPWTIKFVQIRPTRPAPGH